MHIIKNKKIFIGISLALVVSSILAISIRGLSYGIDFTGGAITEISYLETPDINEIKSNLASASIDAQVQAIGETGVVIKTKELNEEQRKTIATLVVDPYEGASIDRYNSIGPSVGKELRTKSLYALILVSLGIVLFIAYAFRKISEPISSWKYGFVAVITLLHDILIPVGILTLLGVEIDTLYVVGLLSILGLSVNDTIVVFDRIREQLSEQKEQDFDKLVGDAIYQTIARSLFTSLTLIAVLLALYVVGPDATQNLSLVLLLGTIVGTYSSMFLASPLLTSLVSKKGTQ